VLAALSYAHDATPIDQDPRITMRWFVPGRWLRLKAPFTFMKNSSLNTWFEQIDKEGESWPPLAAGMFGGNYDRFLQLRLAFENYFNSLTL
jgi:hypothetical protein